MNNLIDSNLILHAVFDNPDHNKKKHQKNKHKEVNIDRLSDCNGEKTYNEEAIVMGRVEAVDDNQCCEDDHQN